jgi:hypothetical protein
MRDGLRALWWAVLLLALPAAAEVPGVPGQANIRVARFPNGATTVVADVLEIGGVQIGNNVATTRAQLDSADTDAFFFNLAGVAGYPVNCEPKTYLVRFVPDGADCSTGGTPSSCVEEVVDVGGYLCKANPKLNVSYVYTSATVAGQGISQAVMDYFGRHGQLPIRWRILKTAEDLNFTSPDHVAYEVYFYSTVGAYPHLTCTVLTTTDPNTALPSSAACAGN